MSKKVYHSKTYEAVHVEYAKILKVAETEFVKSIREKMKELLAQCKPEEQKIFAMMYDRLGFHENTVDAIPLEKMDWAFHQLERTLCPVKKIESYLEGSEKGPNT